KAAELSPSRSSPLVLASPFLNAHTLNERIELVLKNRSQRAVSRRAAVCLALLRRRFDPQDEATGMAVGGQLCVERLHPRRGERMPADVVSVFRRHKGHRQRDCRNREIDEATGSSSCSLQARHRRWHQVAGAIARLREQNSGITE